MKQANVAVVGVGAVGIEMLRCLKQRKFPVKTLKVFGRSARDITVDGETYKVEVIGKNSFEGIDIALFAGTEGEKGAAVTYAKAAVKAGAVVIDNGSDFRMKKNVPLVVPEVNRHTIKDNQGIIANPNCTTIQMLTALNQVHKRFGLKQIILCSYQAVSGAGKQACIGLMDETVALGKQNVGTTYETYAKKLEKTSGAFSSQIAFNVIPQIGGFDDDGFTSEEMKVVHETKKIMGDKKIKVSSTCVRVPVFGAHSEAVYFVTRENVTLEQLHKAFKESEGVLYAEKAEDYAKPLDVEGKDATHVSRLRADAQNKNAFWIWVVADNIRKGAALNAVQIAEDVLKSK